MQSNGARALVALAAIVILAVGYIALTGEEEAGEGSADPPATAATTETAASGSDPEEDPSKTGKDEDLTGLGTDPAKEFPVVFVEGGAPKGGVAELEYDAGDDIRFAVVSDIDEEVHVHGYDIEQDVTGGKPTEIEFPADLDGIYEVEMHGSGVQIAELTVNP